MWFANQREDDLAFGSEVFGCASIGDAIDELLSTALWLRPAISISDARDLK